MSTAKGTRHLLERLAATGTVLLILLLAFDGPLPAWADGVDDQGRAVLLVGRHQVPASGQDRVTALLAAIREHGLDPSAPPEGVRVVAYRPKATAALEEVVFGFETSDEVLVDGPRGTGKTQVAAGTLAALAEMHARAGYPLPLKALWLHDSLKSASAKTARSLEQPQWTGLWSLREDRTIAVLSVGGTEYVTADFVATSDPTAKERLKAECHVVLAEEVVASLSDSAGVDEESYELAITSARLTPNRRKVAASYTNPGDEDSWPALRFGLEGNVGMPRCVRRPIPASDRMSPEVEAAQIAAFRNSPEQQARLGRGEWVALKLGESVTPTFADAHIAPGRLVPRPGRLLIFGHDAGHTPVTIIGAREGGHVNVYAALASEHAGTRQHVTQLVRFWLQTNAPWVLTAPSLQRHAYDPNMETEEQADIDSSPLRVLRELLGGPMLPGATDWPGRIEPVIALLAQFNGATGRPVLQIDPVDGAVLIRALRGRWHYPTVNGKISRDLPKKPNHPWEDLGDSFCYFVGEIAPSRAPRDPNARRQTHAHTGTADVYGDRPRQQYATSLTAVRG